MLPTIQTTESTFWKVGHISGTQVKAGGTGTYVFRYDIVYYSGGTKSVHIDGDVAYEITALDAGHVDMVIHFIRAKNYEDGKFLHDLDSSKIYPNGDLVYKNS